jgi:hypothetical protein
MLVLSGLAMACGDQTTEVVPERETPGMPGSVALATTSTEDGLSITTDKDDYQPGDTVWFTGAGWQANDTLDILLEDEPTTHEPHSWWVPVNETGGFRDSTYVVDVGDLGVTFTLTATSRGTGRSLTVQFMDGLISAASLAFFPAGSTSGGPPPTDCTGTAGTSVQSGTQICAKASFTISGSGGTPVSIRWLNPSGQVVAVSARASNFPNATTGGQSFAAVFTPTVTGPWSAMICESSNIINTGANADGCPSGSARDTATFTVTAAAVATTTSVISSQNPSEVGQSVTFTAGVTKGSPAVTVSDGQVAFKSGGTSCADATEVQAATNVDGNGQVMFTTSSLALGSHVIRGCYGGAAGFLASEGSVTQQVDNTATEIDLASSPNPSITGQSVVFTAKVTNNSNPVSAGQLAFKKGGNTCSDATQVQAPQNLVGGQLTYTASFAASESPITIRACYGGSATPLLAASEAAIVQAVAKADQTITFAALANKTFGDIPFSVSATASSNLAVTFTLGSGSAGCSVSGNTVTIVGATPAGQFCTIVAQQGGNDDYNPAEDVSRSFSIAKAATTTVVESSQSPTVFGEPVTFTATVSATPSGLSGTVTFKNGPATLGTGTLTCGATCTAQLTTAALPAGSHTGITANYGGNANFESSTSAAITQVVNPAFTSTVLTATAYTATYGDEDVTFTANVAANAPSTATVDEGAVKFTVKQGATEIGTVSGAVGNGVVTADFPLLGVNAGGYNVEAVYQPAAANPNFLASSDPTPASLTVNRAPTSTAIESLSGAPYYVNGAVTVNFSVAPANTAGQFGSPPSGTVQVNNGSAPCSATLPATTCDYTPTTVGNHDLTASYSGDGNFLPSSSSPAVRITVAYKFLGFFAPVDRPNTYNVSKAGQSIPLKWRLLDANDQPVTNLTAVNIAITSLSCSSSTVTDLIEEYAPGASGLQNQGDGYYQFNWKTPPSYALTCKNIGLDFGNGYVERALANFNFKK